MNPTEHIGNEYDAMVGEQQEHEEVKMRLLLAALLLFFTDGQLLPFILIVWKMIKD